MHFNLLPSLCRLVALMIGILSLSSGTALHGQPQDFVEARPDAVGVSNEALNELSETVESYIEGEMALGAELVVIKNRKVVLHKSFGTSNREDQTDWTNHTLCNIRSMTKPLTGAALQILIDRGEVEIDAAVAKYLPDGFDNEESRQITIRQILTHRSGLPLTILEDIRQFPDLQAQANAVGVGGPEFEPDSKFWYSDAASDVVGAVVEKVSGMPLAEFVDRELLRPLGMNSTFYGVDGTEERLNQAATLYFGSPNAWLRIWSPEDGPFYPFAWGSQSLYSTTLDYAKFLAMLMDDGMVGDRRILSSAAVSRILNPVSEMGTLGSDAKYPSGFQGLPAYYGQMAILYCPADDPDAGPQIIGHSGSDGTAAWAIPDQDLVVIYYTQSRGGATVVRLEREIDRLLVNPDAYLTSDDIPERFQPLVGTYVANFATFENEEFKVQVQDGKLAVDIPSQMVFELVEPNEDGKWGFAIAPTQIQVSFDHNDDGQVNVMRLHQSGRTFDVPRKGSALEEEMAKARAAEDSQRIVVDVDEMRALTGTFANDDASVEVFIEDDGLRAKFPPSIVVNLRTTKEEDVWSIKEDPAVSLSFQRDEDGQVISLTRHYRGEGLVFSRKE